MAGLNFKCLNVKKCRRYLFIFILLAGISGCAIQPAQPADPFATLEALDVKFLHQPPPDAKFIARISCSSGSYDHWQEDCICYLRTQTVKLGGNAVVPAVELDWGTHKIYNDDSIVRHSPGGFGEHHLNPRAPGQFIPEKLHFWSNIYYCPEYD